ncbi:MAG: D-alanyl-D-alanine carboxypeptidase [Bacilli bacterium]|nr:D-alanyl-D-alanine carboxypeptidase [Bacilli bacterium]
MKKIFYLIIGVMCLLPIKIFAVNITASSAILMDMDSNRILYSKDIHNIRSVASISKIMTAVIAIESGKLDEVVTIGDEIDKAYGSGIYIKKGEQLSLRDLVYGLMLRSGNDAAFAIAKYVGGSEFIEMMNNKATEIGMINTTFNNPCGLDEESGNYSTAYDMAILTSYAMKLDEYKKIIGTKTYKLKTNKNNYIWHNKHKLLGKYEYVTGGKTGYTKKALRTLVTTASKDNLNLVAVTLNDGNDFKDHISLFKYGFANYKKEDILTKGKINIYDDIYYGIYDLSIDKNISYPINNQDNVYLKYRLDQKPHEGSVGTVTLYVNEKEVLNENVDAKKIKRKESHNIIEWFGNLW